MEMTLDERTIDMLAHRVAVIVAKRVRELQAEDAPEMVTTEEAAKLLNITPGHMRRISGRFPHVKQGEHKQGKLLFVRKALLENY